MPRRLEQLSFRNTYAGLPAQFHHRQSPQGLQQAKLVAFSPGAAALIDLDPAERRRDEFIACFSGNAQLPDAEPLAMVYAGHQFGVYNPQLGDGRGLLLGEVESTQHGKWDLHLKGAGQTPYSRFGDGRAVLRSSIREFLASEAMAGLGVPTTRALCVIGSRTQVQRETMETGATLLRMARCHVRFGHFEFFHYNGHHAAVRQLADYVIEQHFPQAAQLYGEQRYGMFLQQVVERTALLIAHWQATGFAHGVMNTDNMSIIGDTFDYGPYGFLDDFEPGFICNHSDQGGRYAFNQQPGIALWNLNALAHALSSLMPETALREALAHYQPVLTGQFHALMRGKLGLQAERANDGDFFLALMQLMAQNPIDYTHFFRTLSYFDTGDHHCVLRDEFVDRDGFDRWLASYRERLATEPGTDNERRARMLRCNPKFVLRNYLAQEAIEHAQREDYSKIDALMAVLQNPFEEHPAFEALAAKPPDSGKHLEISCSS